MNAPQIRAEICVRVSITINAGCAVPRRMLAAWINLILSRLDAGMGLPRKPQQVDP